MIDEAALVSGRISFTVKTTGQTFRFDTFKEFLSWASDQQQRWSVVLEPEIRNAFPQLSVQATKIIDQMYSGLLTALTPIASSEPGDGSGWTDETVNTHINDLSSDLEFIIDGKVPIADSASGEKIISLAKTDPRRTAALLILAVDHPSVNGQAVQNFDVIRSLINELDFPESDEKILATENQLRKMRQRWDGKLTSIVRDLEKRRNLEDQSREKFSEEMKRGDKLFQSLFIKSNQERHEHQKEMQRIESVFETHLALQAPATYWSKKELYHLVVASAASVVFFTVAVLTIWLAWSHGPAFVKEVTAGQQGFNMGAFAMITIPALIGAWAMRFIARIFVSNLHLSQDAGLRSTMITTYLALMKDPSSEVTREERALILNAMFRPADNHGDDDGPSPKLIDLMQKMSSR